MRNRFFFIILTTLVLAAVAINLVHVRFFQSQRLKLIDKQIAESSDSLMASGFFRNSDRTPEAIEEAISKILKGTRIGKVFVLRDKGGKIRYQSFNVGLLEAELPTAPEWVTVETDTEYVRVKNIVLRDSRILQVGLVLDRNFINWEIIDQRVVNYVAGIVLALFIASVILTLLLLSPLRHLIEHLQATTSNLDNLRNVEPLPGRLARFTRGYWAQSDEFSSLLSTVQMLINRINLNYKLTRSWTHQMAHELKTPLAIIQAETDSKRKAKLLPDQYSQDVLKEVHQMSGIISQFLEWAELENSQLQKELHAMRIKSVVKSVAARMEKISPQRLVLSLETDFSVFSSPGHLDQLISNLISNALKFSPADSKVEVSIQKNTLQISDHGAGISKEVLERIGEPFNIGRTQDENATGNGLGLAWVSTVAKLYHWKLSIQSSPQGTQISVHFPNEDQE